MPWTLIEDLFYTVWTEDDFFYVPEYPLWNPDPDGFFYVPETSHWAEDDYFYVPDSFYWDERNLFYFDTNRWLLPLDHSFEHVKATANYEEIVVKPEDLAIVPEQVQFMRTEWEREEPVIETMWSVRND